MYDEGGIYMDTDHIALRSFDDLRRFRVVFGRQGANEHGHQVAVGCFLAEPKSPVIGELYARMLAKFDGGWASHSIMNVDSFFRENKPPGALVCHAHSIHQTRTTTSMEPSTKHATRRRVLVPHPYPDVRRLEPMLNVDPWVIVV
jgi:hypothetical protein